VKPAAIKNNLKPLKKLCSSLECANAAASLQAIIEESLALFVLDSSDGFLSPEEKKKLSPMRQGTGSRRIFHEEMIRCWSEACDGDPTEKLVSLFVCMKLHDSASQGLLNRRRRSQHIPDKVFEALRDTEEKWQFPHYLAGLDFLQDTAMGPNGDVFKTIWKIRRNVSKPASIEEQAQEVKSLLGLVSKQPYHHNLSDFKRILKMVPPSHEFLALEFRPKVQLGIYQAITFLFETHTETSFPLKRKIIHLFDSARGKDPKPKWCSGLAAILDEDFHGITTSFADWIIQSQTLRYPNGESDWQDDIFVRFLKSAEWIQSTKHSGDPGNCL
jgi:hypothetical protein